ncbi:deoxyguanosinetriphosphate triphosphohydrolase [Inmirania thermothiophila]|nr:deoxyguanosinetriphosphate triphosphohydrolase [Inmirania thermothiophila]
MPAARLAPYAASAASSRGRRHPEPPPRYRGEYQRDRDRIIHCAAFRRLEYKTQVFVNHEGDLFRTRLTHSLEVAQIARTVARALGLDEDLTEGIALAHDLGHPPFGHAGQEALDACMAPWGGFEHNLQALRVVDELEERYARFRGLNLMFETREGLLKHCPPARARGLGEVARRFLDGTQPTLEAQVVNLADEIAYHAHDVDDGLRAGLLRLEELAGLALVRACLDEVEAEHPGLGGRRRVHELVRRLIDRQVTDLIEATAAALEAAAPADVEAVRARPEPLARHSEAMRRASLELKGFLRERLYRHYRVERMTAKARRVVTALFEAFVDNPRLLPPAAREAAARLEAEAGEAGRARAVADYIAGMTDRYALAEHRRLFDPPELT